jgi:hypothetical protein
MINYIGVILINLKEKNKVKKSLLMDILSLNLYRCLLRMYSLYFQIV